MFIDIIGDLINIAICIILKVESFRHACSMSERAQFESGLPVQSTLDMPGLFLMLPVRTPAMPSNWLNN